MQLRWEVKNLPRFVQWRMPGAGTHVLGIEPANCYAEGLLAEQSKGTLVMLEPGEQHEYLLRFDIDAKSQEEDK